MTRFLCVTLALASCSKPHSQDSERPVVVVVAPAPTAIVAPRASADASQTIPIGPDDVALTWTGSKVTGSHAGGFATITGELTLHEGQAHGGSVNVTIAIGSLFAEEPKLQAHLLTADFLDASGWPTATFASTRIRRIGASGTEYHVTGNLTLRGVVAPVEFPATIRVTESVIEANAELVIGRKRFGISYPGIAGDLIADEVPTMFSLRIQR